MPVVYVAAAHPKDPHILARPYSKPYLIETLFIYESITPYPALKIKPR